MFKVKESLIGMAIGAVAGLVGGYFFGIHKATPAVEVVVEATNEE